MPLVLRFAFLTAGHPKNEGARNCRAVACSFLGLVRMTCGAWPPCHKVRSLAHARGDFTCDASGVRAGGSAFKKGSITRAIVMPRSSCDHRTSSPSGPPDGVRRCSVVHSCRNGAGVPLVRECNDICLRAKCNNICMQDFSLGSPVVCPNPLDGGFKY
jgi:hypothetical protein